MPYKEYCIRRQLTFCLQLVWRTGYAHRYSDRAEICLVTAGTKHSRNAKVALKIAIAIRLVGTVLQLDWHGHSGYILRGFERQALSQAILSYIAYSVSAILAHQRISEAPGIAHSFHN